MKQEVSHKITLFNWFMALLLVYYHWHGQFMDVSLFSEKQPIVEADMQRWNLMFNNVGGMVVSYFFLMSGLLLYRGATRKNIRQKVCRRIYSLGVPFLLWNMIVVLYRFVMFRTMCFSDWKSLALGFTLAPFDSPLWYMLVVLVFSLFAPIFIWIKDSKGMTTILMCGLFIASTVVFFLVMPNRMESIWFGWYWNRLIGYLPVYLIGCYVGMYFDAYIFEERYQKNLFAIIGLVVVLGSIIVFWDFGDEGVIPIVMQRVQAIALWFMLPGDLFKWKPALPFKTSVIIYAMHQPILIPLTNSWVTSAWMNGAYTLAGHIFISFAAVVVLYLLCLVMIYAMKLILNEKIFAALSGGRVS